MNWKFTEVKTITSVIIGLVLGLLGYAFLGTGWFGGTCEIMQRCPGPPLPLPVYVYILFSIVLVYLIWSLIQKKEIVEIQKKGTDDNSF